MVRSRSNLTSTRPSPDQILRWHLSTWPFSPLSEFEWGSEKRKEVCGIDFWRECHLTYQLCEARWGDNSLRDVVLNNLEWFSTDMVLAFPPRTEVPDISNHKAESSVLSGRPRVHTGKNISENSVGSSLVIWNVRDGGIIQICSHQSEVESRFETSHSSHVDLTKTAQLP